MLRTHGRLVILLALAAAASARAQGLSDVLLDGQDWQVAVEGLGFADGLSYDAAGNVYFADLRGPNAGVYRIAPDGTKSKVDTGGRSGTRPGPDGRLYACGGSTLLAINPADGKTTTVAEGLGTNDLAVSRAGHVYITDTGKKQITLVDVKTGRARPADVGITAPNGIGLSPDHATLYVSDYGGVKVWSFKVGGDGRLSDKKALMTMKAPENKPTVASGDGMTTDAAGRVYVTTALGLQVFDARGKLLGVLPKPGNGPLVSAGFGGKDLDQLYVACGDKLYRRKTRAKGAPAPALPAAAAAARQEASRYDEPFRPQFHFSPERNWMNDPNGMVFFDGEYHLFYQYNPEGDTWGHMSWGHAVSTDLVRWKHLPVALREEDGVMIFSGSAVVDHKNTSGFGKDGKPPLVAIYTGHGKGKQVQSIAYSTDRGRTWTKYAQNPVIDINSPEFRDPKVFWYERTKQWVMVVAKPDQRKVQFWGSPDLKRWAPLGEFGKEGAVGGIWECPDLFQLPVYRGEQKTGQTRWVLVVNINGGTPAGGSGCQYFIGNFDGRQFDNNNSSRTVLWADYGPDFYAGVSWSDLPRPDEKRVWLGWMSNWRYADKEPTSPWRTAQSFPRELCLRETPNGLRLAQAPARELAGLRDGAGVTLKARAVSDDSDALLGSGLSGDTLELVATFENVDAKEFGLKVRMGQNQQTVVGYDVAKTEYFIDRTRSGRTDFHKEFAGRHAATAPSGGKQVVMHVLVDRSSVELFGDNGLAVVTDRVFPDAASQGVATYAVGGRAKLVSLQAWKLKSAWK